MYSDSLIYNVVTLVLHHKDIYQTDCNK